MATYAIGDIQGCLRELEQLLKKIDYSPSRDALYCCGDLVNRGPDSLGVLRLLMNLPNVKAVLGNHDLYLIAIYFGVLPKSTHTLAEVLKAPDVEAIIQWLLQQSFLIEAKDHVLVHAGITPQWDIHQAKIQAEKLIKFLRQLRTAKEMQQLFGNEPRAWQPGLTQWDDMRYSLNAFTRMRFCDANGVLDFTKDGVPEDAPLGFKPWFDWPERKTREQKIVFGHWAALDGVTGLDSIIATDTGCAWGRKLTAYRLDDGERFSVVAIR